MVGHPDKFSDNIALSFRDILSLDGRLTKTWQFTYVVDLDWLLEEYPDNAAEGPIFLFLGWFNKDFVEKIATIHF